MAGGGRIPSHGWVRTARAPLGRNTPAVGGQPQLILAELTDLIDLADLRKFLKDPHKTFVLKVFVRIF